MNPLIHLLNITSNHSVLFLTTRGQGSTELQLSLHLMDSGYFKQHTSSFSCSYCIIPKHFYSSVFSSQDAHSYCCSALSDFEQEKLASSNTLKNHMMVCMYNTWVSSFVYRYLRLMTTKLWIVGEYFLVGLCLGEIMCIKPKYLHVAILISVGEDVPLDVSQRRDPGQNSGVHCYIGCLQVCRGIDVCGSEWKSVWITTQEPGV